jgi:hypothetical protein
MALRSPRKATAVRGATRRGHYRTIAGLPADTVISGVGGGSAPGITELTGDVTAGPGSGAVAATIAALAVTAAKIAADAVITVKILDANVTTAKIADVNVTTAKIAGGAVTDAKIRDSAALSVIGRSANSIGVPGDMAASTNGHVLQRLANVLGFRALDVSAITDGTITLAKLADLANQRVIGRNTAGTGVPEAVTFSQLLDWVSASVAQGDILYRGASGWARLAAGTNGQLLKTGGASANPSWTGIGCAALRVVVGI